MVEINRVWLNVDTDTNKITLFDRPRVSIRVDEYIWSLIEEHIVKPHKLMLSEKHRYLLKISFHRFDPVRHRYYPLSPYNGPLREGVKSDSANGWYPREDFADAEERTTWFSPDKIWTNWSMVESFPFPASFEEQQYIGDEGKIHVYSWDGQQETTLVGPYSVRELYLDHFGKS